MLDDVEAFILTGGASRRMGQPKSALTIGGRTVLEVIASELRALDLPVTVLGPDVVAGCRNVPDTDHYQGPLSALANCVPDRPFCFVVSCDLPGFQSRLVTFLRDRIDGYQAAVPSISGRSQPLCALYRREAWNSLRALHSKDERRVMKWVAEVAVLEVTGEEIRSAGIDPDVCANINTPEEYRAYLDRQ